MRLSINDLVAVSLMNKNTQYGRLVSVDKKKVTVNVGGNIITAEPRQVTKVYDKKLLKRIERQDKSKSL